MTAFAMTAQDQKLITRDQIYAVAHLNYPAIASQFYMAFEENTIGTMIEIIQRNFPIRWPNGPAVLPRERISCTSTKLHLLHASLLHSR